MASRKTYEIGDNYIALLDAAEKLDSRAESDEDCLGALCSLSGVGEWGIDKNGRRVYRAALDENECQGLTETGVQPVETYAAGDPVIPTRVARHFGLGERVACESAGHFLQGDEMIERPVFRLRSDGRGEMTPVATTLQDILRGEVEDEASWMNEVYWKDLEWRHLQLIVDESGGQSERFRLLARILKNIGEAHMMEGMFVPYGHQLGDSDLIDAI